MTHYYIEYKLGAKWVLITTKTRHTDALHYVKEHPGSPRYPVRVVRVVRTVVLEDKSR
jgi:hypothetical protein